MKLDYPSLPELPRCAPPRPLPSATLADAYANLAGTMLQFYAPPQEGVPGPQIQMGGQGGTGKTEIAVRFTREGLRQDVEHRRPGGMIVLVPEHQVLGRQLVARYSAAGHDVAPLLGRGDPFNPKDDDLCTQPEAVAEALKADRDIPEGRLRHDRRTTLLTACFRHGRRRKASGSCCPRAIGTLSTFGISSATASTSPRW